MGADDDQASRDTKEDLSAPNVPVRVIERKSAVIGKRKPMTAFELWTIRLTAIAIIVAGATGLVLYLTLIEIRNGGRDTHTLAEAAKAQADKAETISGSVKKAVDQMERTANLTEGSMQETARQAQRALDASIRASQLSERPWVVVSSFRLSQEPEADKDFTVDIGIENTGKTPAIDVQPYSHLLGWFRDPPALSLETPNVFVKSSKSRAILPPSGLPPAGTPAHRHFTTAPLKLSESQISAYKAGFTNIYVRGRVRYTDTFHKRHWTDYCIVHVYGKPLDEFYSCNTGNEVDRQQ